MSNLMDIAFGIDSSTRPQEIKIKSLKEFCESADEFCHIIEAALENIKFDRYYHVNFRGELVDKFNVQELCEPPVYGDFYERLKWLEDIIASCPSGFDDIVCGVSKDENTFASMYWRPPCTTEYTEVSYAFSFKQPDRLYKSPEWVKELSQHFGVSPSVPYLDLLLRHQSIGAMGIKNFINPSYLYTDYLNIPLALLKYAITPFLKPFNLDASNLLNLGIRQLSINLTSATGEDCYQKLIACIYALLRYDNNLPPECYEPEIYQVISMQTVPGCKYSTCEQLFKTLSDNKNAEYHELIVAVTLLLTKAFKMLYAIAKYSDDGYVFDCTVVHNIESTNSTHRSSGWD